MTSPTPPQVATVGGSGTSLQPPVSLSALLTPLNGLSDVQVEALAQQLFDTQCVALAKAGTLVAHDGLPVRAYPNDFDHACFTSLTRKDRGRKKEVIDRVRIERLRWIAPVIAGQVADTECWRWRDWAHRPPPEQRLYLLVPEQYVIWLWVTRGGLKFRTAYRANAYEIKVYLTRQTKIWPRP